MEDIILDGQYWSNRYLNNQTGWDIGSSATPLANYIDQLTNKNLRILIPGCGNAYEAEYLLEKGFTNITVLDISEVLVKYLQEKFKGNPHITILLEDFFEHQGTYDLVLEQTFFCAINPTLRQPYAIHMAQILKKQGKLVGLLFNKNFEVNPPFGGSKNEYIAYFEPYFEFKTFEICYNSIAPRAESELFINFIKK
ncbi:MAG: TPMT family class I SAM-dependent methyltransferase [Raineya sp.]|jgi:SAM-dependent methyltransferase|nr:TPMT family class I SAM-dependent methyltransferase [Raineya sp.]